MKTIKRIIGTLVVMAITLPLLYLCVEGASTSSGHTVDERRTSLMWFLLILALALLSVIAIWLPWKKWRG